jgi:hypothetical protein
MRNLKGRDNLYDLDVDGKMIWKSRGGRVWTGVIWFGIRDEWISLVNTIIKFRFYIFLNWLSDRQLLKKDSASWNEFSRTLNWTVAAICSYLLIRVLYTRPPLWSSGESSWLQIQRSRVGFRALPDFLRSSGSGTGSTQPREDNWGATWMEK